MCEYNKIDSPDKALDYAIRDYECKKFPVGSGYNIENNIYFNYLSKNSWKEFKDSMKKVHQRQFEDADGEELKEKKGRWGICPPKMASFGSSSRFIYNISKDIVGFQFEKLLPTRVGGTANLDGYIMRGDVDVFVEAKCKEIYSSHKTKDVSDVYRDVYMKLVKTYNKFSYKNNGQPIKKRETDDEHFKCTFKFDGEDIVYFDIKQLICHFLAISANILENEKANKNVKFVYLIFNPKDADAACFENEKVSSYKERIFKIYDETIKEIRKFYMKELFESIFEIQAKRLGLEGEKDSSFEFHLVDQDDYKKIIK